MPRRFTLGTVEVLFRARTDRFRTAMRVAETSITRNERALLRFQTRMVSFSSASRLVSENIGTLSIIAAGLAVRSFASFDQSMATVRGTAQATTREFRILRKQAADLGRTTRFTAVQAAEGQLFLARAGFKVNEIFQALPGTLRLAQATQIEIGRSANIVTNIMSAFGVEVSETSRFVDVLAKATAYSNTNIEQLSEAMKFIGPISNLLNISLEETGAFIGILGDNGIPATLAGAGLRRSFLRLVRPTGEVRDTIKQLGLTLDDINIVTNGATEVMERFANANLTAEQAVKIFGVRGIGVASILQNNIRNIRELNQQLLDSAGFSNNLAQIMDATLSGAALRALSATQGLVIAFLDSDNRASTLSDTLDSVARSINRVTDNIDTFGPIISNALGFLVLFRLASTQAAIGLASIASSFLVFGSSAGIARSVGATTRSILGFSAATGGAAAVGLSFSNVSRASSSQLKTLSAQVGISSAAMLGFRRNVIAVRGALLALGKFAVMGAIIESFVLLGGASSSAKGQFARAQKLIEIMKDFPPETSRQFEEYGESLRVLAKYINDPSIGLRILDYFASFNLHTPGASGVIFNALRNQIHEGQQLLLDATPRDPSGVVTLPGSEIVARAIPRPRPPIDPFTGLTDQEFFNSIQVEITRLREGAFAARRKEVALSDLLDTTKAYQIGLINTVEAAKLEVDAQNDATRASESRNESIQSMLLALQTQALSYNLTNREILINSFVQKRASDETISAATALFDYNTAQEASLVLNRENSQSIQGIISGLQDQALSYVLTTEQILVNSLVQKRASKETIDGAVAFQRFVDTQEMAREASKGRQQEIARYAQQLSDTTARFFSDAILGSDSLSESIRNLGQELLNLTIRFTLLEPLADFFSGGLSRAFGMPSISPFDRRQTGGLAFGPTLVGEAGAELINVTNPSRVTPNNQLGFLGSRPEVNIHITINGGDEASVNRALSKAIPVIRQEALAAVIDTFGTSGELRAISRGF